jgi:alkaline phosphatase
MTRIPVGLLLAPLVFSGAAKAAAIFPIDRATVLAGSRFDIKVEFDQVVPQREIRLTVGGRPAEAVFGRPGIWLEREDGKPATSWVLQGASLAQPGPVEVVASGGGQTLRVRWQVLRTGPRRAKNVILFIGDGMTMANRTAARLLSRGMQQGKYNGRLVFEDFPHTALVGTSGMDSIVTDSANSMSAYTTGHKTALNAMGVYASRAENDFEHPRVETLVELVKRRTHMAVGVVTDAEVEDATPAAMVAHTRRRARKAEIASNFVDDGVDVLLGGGRAYFLPRETPGSKREDGLDPLERYRAAGYRYGTTATELRAQASSPGTRKLLGLFHPDNMDGVLDRRFLKKGTVAQFPDQPDLTDMTRSAIEVLSRNPDGFVLMVEAGLIDKFSHRLDWERATWDTIMLSNAVGVAREFAAKRNDTLILVTADHTHGLSIVGTVDDAQKGEPRDRVRTYAEAGFPDYPPPDAEGYPPRPDVTRRLAVFFSDTPDHWENREPYLDGPAEPTVPNPAKKGTYLANPAEQKRPGAVLVQGNLPRSAESGVHTMDDVTIDAMGPGSERVHGFIDNTEVFRIMAEALGLGNAGARRPTPAQAGPAAAK